MHLFLLVALIVLVVVCWPIALIWAVNTLFGTNIVLGWGTWAAALILSAPFASTRSNS